MGGVDAVLKGECLPPTSGSSCQLFGLLGWGLLLCQVHACFFMLLLHLWAVLLQGGLLVMGTRWEACALRGLTGS